MGLPDRVRFVIAQRHEDLIIKAVKDRELRDLCVEPINLDKMNRKEGQEFIEIFDPGIRLKGETQEIFWKRYGGWPLLMELALEEIEKSDTEITEEFVKSLPADIAEFWQQRYRDIREKESRILVQTVCLLPHAYPRNRLAEFAGLDPDQMESAWDDRRIWCMLDKQNYEETLTEQSWNNCPAPRHETAREYVLERLEQDENLKQKRYATITAHYQEQIGPDEDFETTDVDKDVLVYLPVCLVESKDWGNLISEVQRLTAIKMRYGLLDSLIADLQIGLKMAEANEDIAVFSSNLGTVYRIRGDLDRAEAMYKKSLEIEEVLGSKKGMASDYGNLGLVYEARGDLDRAEVMWKKSLELYEAIGAKPMIQQIKGWLEELRESRKE